MQQGILVERVTPGGPAAQAGIHGGSKAMLSGLQELRVGGDVLVAWDDKPLASQLDLNLLLNRAWPGDSVNLTLVRDGQENHATRKTRRRPRHSHSIATSRRRRRVPQCPLCSALCVLCFKAVAIAVSVAIAVPAAVDPAIPQIQIHNLSPAA